MPKFSAEHIKKNGVYFTPFNLAKFLISSLVFNKDLSIFDPAYGEGALLLAAEKKCREFGVIPKVYGCDKAPLNGFLNHIKQINLVKQNFLDYPFEKNFDLILMNPPYVRHHRISQSKKKRYQKIVEPFCRLKSTSDLWVYFLVKSVKHLEKGGRIGAILPRSFLQADYARNVRSWLSEHFRSIKVVSLATNYFENTQERVVLVWLENYGEKVNSIKVAFAKSIEDKINFLELQKSRWEDRNVVFSEKNDTNEIMSEYLDKYGFTKFNNWANIKIGVVTGAEDFFIATKKKANDNGFYNEELIHILTSSKEFKGLHFNGYKPSNYLLYISSNYLKGKRKEYIKTGEKIGYHLRAHSQNREVWYMISPGKTPDAFFPYRATHFPYLAFNDSGIQCTNSIHRIYFKNLTENEKKWLQISLLSAIGQLSLEAFSKIYGKGVLKIEPSSLKNTIVYVSKDDFPKSIYKEISKFILSNEREKASEIATQFISERLKIASELTNKTVSGLKELQSRRLIE